MLKAGDCFCGADVGGCSSGTADSFKQLGTVCDPHKGKWPSVCSRQAVAQNHACPPFAHLNFGCKFNLSAYRAVLLCLFRLLIIQIFKFEVIFFFIM